MDENVANKLNFPFSKIELSAIFTIAFVLANTFIFILQFGYLSEYGIAYDYINVSLTSLIISFIISVFFISLCKLIMDAYTKVFTTDKKMSKITKKDKSVATLYNKMKKRLVLKSIILGGVYSFFISIYIFIFSFFKINLFNIDIYDFMLVFISIPALLIICTIVLVFVNVHTKKINKSINSSIGHSNRGNAKVDDEKAVDIAKKKIVNIYVIITVIFFLVLMVFLFVSGKFIASHKSQYSTFYEDSTQKNYLIITAYSEYRIVMEYDYDELNDAATLIYGKYKIIPLNEVNEKIHSFKDVYITKDDSIN